METKCVSWFWKFGNLAWEKFWKHFGNIVKGVCTNPVFIPHSMPVFLSAAMFLVLCHCYVSSPLSLLCF